MLGFAALMISLTTQYSVIKPVVHEVESYMYAQQVDIETDSSITKFVGPLDPLNEPRYRPIDLVDLNGAAFIRVQ